jgi:hypothetical protein
LSRCDPRQGGRQDDGKAHPSFPRSQVLSHAGNDQLVPAGCELQAAGREDSDEFKRVDKQLNWVLLRRPGQTSVFDRDLDGRMPGYMARLASGADWPDAVSLRKALLQAIA